MRAAPSVPADPRTLPQLRSILLQNAAAMREALGPAPELPAPIDAAVYERRIVEAGTDAAALAQFFVLGRPVVAERIARAIQPVTLDALEDAGLGALEHDIVRPLARITSYEGTLITSDLLGGSQPRDFVAGSSPAAERVAQLTIRTRVARALDLGTGSGLQALLAAQHCDGVVGVDLNARALAMARFNAALNGVTSVDFREGSWFDPVAGEQFDLIVANPPYVISPDAELLYRDSGLPGDAVTMNLLRDVPAYLADGGFAVVMGNWIHDRDGDWRAPLDACVENTGCDAVFLKYATIDPALYAAHWNKLQIRDGWPAFLRTIDRWLDYDRRHNITAISEGCIILRRRPGASHWTQAIEVPGAPGRHAGDHVRRLFVARDRRDELADDEGLLSTRFSRPPSLKLVMRASGERLTQRTASAEIEDGIGFSVPIRPELEMPLLAMDGAAPLRDLSVPEPARPDIRRLHALGLIVAVDAAHAAL